MQRIGEIIYAQENAERGLGDLYLPDEAEGAPAALVIHGGGWNAMDKHGLAGVAEFMAELGFGAYNVNYRLLDHAPWPACGDDCLAAARFLLEAGHEAMAQLDRRRLVIIGASAGGHLALMTGLRLPPEQVRAIVSIAGPTDLLWRTRQRGRDYFRKFFGTDGEITDEMLLAASPVTYVTPQAPPLLCTSSTNDTLVPTEASRRIVAEYEQLGARAELYAYDGPGEQHGIWIEGTDPHRLIGHIEEAIAAFIETV